MMLTLLSYCYAVGIYGSEDIAWAARYESTVRYICAHKRPDWRMIRWFRRQYRQPLKECLGYLIKQAWALKFGASAADCGGDRWIQSTLDETIKSLVEDKLDVAAVMDRDAMEV
jgi:hypothetical protein